jgi:hypothetical protein
MKLSPHVTKWALGTINKSGGKCAKQKKRVNKKSDWYNCVCRFFIKSKNVREHLWVNVFTAKLSD